MAGQSNPYTPITFSAVLPLKNGIFTVNMHTIKWGWAYLRKKNYRKYALFYMQGVGIFTEITVQCIFSGKTAENVIGVYGFDCPAIF